MRRRPGLVLAASTVGFSMVLIDTTVVNIAAPAIRGDLHASASTLVWIVNAYTLVFAALLLSTGALADRIGPRNVFLAGLGVFAAGSAAAAAAPSAAALIAAQGVLGLGAALVLPTSLALLTHAYADARARTQAIGVWAAGSAVAFAAGPVLGGALVDGLGWRSIFLVNLPSAAVAAGLAWTTAPRVARGAGRPVGALGQTVAVVALGALTVALVESGDRGWTSATVLIALAVALAAGAWVLTHERRAATPMLPPALSRDRSFSASTAAGALLNLAFYGELFVMSLFLQQERGLSALEAGLAFLPQPLLFILVSPLAGRLIARAGPRTPLALGSALSAIAALLLLGVSRSSPYLVLGAGLALNGIGGGLAIPAVTAGVVGGVARELSGIASAALNAGRQMGGVLGVALLGSLAATGDPVTGLRVAVAVAGVALAIAAVLARAVAPGPVRAAVEERRAEARRPAVPAEV